jgi:hypothetical protein
MSFSDELNDTPFEEDEELFDDDVLFDASIEGLNLTAEEEASLLGDLRASLGSFTDSTDWLI